jgi:hypothetical protein
LQFKKTSYLFVPLINNPHDLTVFAACCEPPDTVTIITQARRGN